MLTTRPSNIRSRPPTVRARHPSSPWRLAARGTAAVLGLAAAAALAACGGGSGTGGADADHDGGDTLDAGDETEAKITFVCDDGQRLESRLNVFYAAGQRREVYIDLPNVDADTRVAVLFGWHGVGDTATNFRSFVINNGVRPDGDPDFPFILVVPQGLRLSPLQTTPAQGLEWDILAGDSGSDNLEAQLFEGVLGCLAADFNIDPARIYNIGFSGGAIVSTMLHSRYPKNVAAVLAMSGAWFNDPNQASSVNTGGYVDIDLSWDELDPADTGLVLQTHGGPNDGYAPFGNFEIINFDYCAAQAKTFLPANNRTVIDCPHRLGHAPHPGLAPRVVFDLFKLHVAGEPSILRTEGAFDGLPTDCEFLFD